MPSLIETYVSVKPAPGAHHRPDTFVNAHPIARQGVPGSFLLAQALSAASATVPAPAPPVDDDDDASL
jgi:hypothetical protein